MNQMSPIKIPLTQNQYGFMVGLLTSEPTFNPIIRYVTKELQAKNLVRLVREMGETRVVLTSLGRTVITAKEEAARERAE